MATTTYNAAGSGTWLCPAGVFSISLVEAWGGGGGGYLGATLGGPGAGGGEYAAEANVAVTPGRLYSWHVASPGGNVGGNGGTSSFAGDTLTITAHGGKGGSGSGPGAGGTGSTNATHHDGGAGGSNGGTVNGGGGGSSGGTAAKGGNGGNGGGGAGGAGGTPPAGAGGGGQGGSGAAPSGLAGIGPGGGGGGAWTGTSHGSAGAAGQVRLTYTLATQPVIPIFPAGFAPLNSNFDAWIQAPMSFLTSRIVFRAEQSNALALANGTTIIPFNNVLEDPFSGWNAGSSQWQCPAGYSGVYSVGLTLSCQSNASLPVLQARVGINASTQLFAVDKAWVPSNSSTVPGIASGALPVSLFGGQDTVQGISFLAGAAGSVATTAGQRCELSIMWISL